MVSDAAKKKAKAKREAAASKRAAAGSGEAAPSGNNAVCAPTTCMQRTSKFFFVSYSVMQGVPGTFSRASAAANSDYGANSTEYTRSLRLKIGIYLCVWKMCEALWYGALRLGRRRGLQTGYCCRPRSPPGKEPHCMKLPRRVRCSMSARGRATSGGWQSVRVLPIGLRRALPHCARQP